MNGNEQFFGMVRSGGFYVFAPQHLEGRTINLTTAQPHESVPPESRKIDLSEYEGKIIEVSGQDTGDWIYSAEVVEEAGPVLSDFLKKVFLKEEADKKRCALVVGHRKDSPGFVNQNRNISEFEFNEQLIPLIGKKVKNATIYWIHRRTYASLPDDINELAPDFIISLHCNTYDGKTSGTEILYHHKSLQGKEIAQILLKHLVQYLGLPDRGIQPKTAEDECGFLLRYASAPCVISKPFYIDNDNDLDRAMENPDALAEAFARAIDEVSRKVEILPPRLGDDIII